MEVLGEFPCEEEDKDEGFENNLCKIREKSAGARDFNKGPYGLSWWHLEDQGRSTYQEESVPDGTGEHELHEEISLLQEKCQHKNNLYVHMAKKKMLFETRAAAWPNTWTKILHSNP